MKTALGFLVVAAASGGVGYALLARPPTPPGPPARSRPPTPAGGGRRSRQAEPPGRPRRRPPTAPTPTTHPDWPGFVAAHYWKLLAVAAVALAGRGGYELSQADKSLQVFHAGTTLPPRHQSLAFHHFEDLSREQSKPATVALKGGGFVNEYYLRADKTFVILSTRYTQTGASENMLIPWDHVAHILTHSAVNAK